MLNHGINDNGTLDVEISEDLCDRIWSAASFSNVAEFVEQLGMADRNMLLSTARPSLSLSESSISAGGGSGCVHIQGTPHGRPSTSSVESASDAAVAVTRGPAPGMARLRAGGNAQDADAVSPTLTRPVASLDLKAAGAAADDDAGQTQAVIDGTAGGPAAAAAAKSESDDDSAPAASRKRKMDADDDRKPPAKRS